MQACSAIVNRVETWTGRRLPKHIYQVSLCKLLAFAMELIKKIARECASMQFLSKVIKAA